MNATTVTLTTASTVYNLFTLMKAIQPTASPSCSQIIVTADPGNGGNVFVGDSTVTTSVFGSKLPPTGSANFNGTFNGLGMESIYLTADTNSMKVDVIAQRM